MPIPENNKTALNCASKVLELSNGNAALYKLPSDGFDFFSGVYLPCLLGLMTWRKTVPNIKKLVVFLREAEKWGVYIGTFDDIPAIQDDSDCFLLFYAVYVLKEYEAGKTPDKRRNERLEKIEYVLASATERIFNGFRNDKDPSHPGKGRKPDRIPSNYASLYKLIRDYYTGKYKPEPARPRPVRPRPVKPEPVKPEPRKTPGKQILTCEPTLKRIFFCIIGFFIPYVGTIAMPLLIILGIKYLIFCRASSYQVTTREINIIRRKKTVATVMIDEIRSVSVSQSPFQKLFGVGDIVFTTSSAESPVLRLREIKDPGSILSEIRAGCRI